MVPLVMRGIASVCVMVTGWLLCLSPALWALSNQDKTVLLTATVQESPAQIRLEWSAPTSQAYVLSHQKLYRRVAGKAWGAE
ncbi:hypothetical protein HW115_07775 [Verrucomicrobiaceae bacterium N1E253]|uniref:Uncharacterized protein n=1 Tax=Oceaniferula marina TaxID=2748318 RepID=A0A851GK10_9BACT|nr:hypothetical protein [Oceaniferula marina]NWK55505.1 hypothetical protein [Oceaniferula marina]